MRIETVETDSTYDWRRDGWLAACALTAIFLIVSAATTHTAGFDTFLRLFVFCMALVRGFAGFRRGGAWLPLSAAVIAILFNPVKPVGMSAAAWTWCDLIAAAWFGIVGAWRLLRSWDPQRGWAVAAVSLGALAVPAVAALSMPNRDALNPMNVDENLAEMNAGGNAAAAPNATPVTEASAVNSTRSASPTEANASASEAADHMKAAEHEVSEKTAVAPQPPLANSGTASPADEPADTTPVNNTPVNNETDGSQDGSTAASPQG